MSNQDAADEIPPQLLAGRPSDYAKRYFDNAKRIGEPGSPDMVQARDFQMQHAQMAQAAALVSIADSLESMMQTSRVNARRFQLVTQAVQVLAKEITKLRYLAKG